MMIILEYNLPRSFLIWHIGVLGFQQKYMKNTLSMNMLLE